MNFLKRFLSFLLVIVMCIGCFIMPIDAVNFNDINQTGVFVKQQANNTCTLASAVMLVRRTALAAGNSNWSSITEVSMKSTAWKDGMGLYFNFTYAGVSVGHNNVTSNQKNKYIELLRTYPQGVVAYNPGNGNQYHAVLLTDYDANTNTFYCADPASGAGRGRIPLTSSTIVGSGQEGKINNLTSYWYVKSPSISLTPIEPTAIVYPTDNGIYKIASGVGSDKYLDFSLTDDNVQIFENCDNHSDPAFVKSQYFKLKHVGDGWYTIVNIGNEKAVDVYNKSSQSQTNVVQYTLHGGDNQLFRFYDAGNGYCYIKSKLGCYVDVSNGDNINKANVWMYTFNASNAQKWKLQSHSHSYSSSITAQPTCTQTGIKTFSCLCGNKYTETVKANGHTVVTDKAVAATCTAVGLTEGSHCSVCKTVITKQNEVPAVGHKHISSVTVQPTCTKDGTETFICSCGDKYTKTIKAIGHKFGEPVPDYDFSNFPYDMQTLTCEICKVSVKEQYTMDLGGIHIKSYSGSDYVKLEWGELDDTSGVKVYKYDDAEKKYVLVKNLFGYSEDYTVTGLKPETEYTFIVSSYGAWGCTREEAENYVNDATKITVKTTKAHTYKTTTTKATLSKNGKIVLACTECGEVSKTTTIYYPKSIKLTAAKYTYNGKVNTPTVTVKDSNGKILKKDTDYTVKYEEGRKLPGKYTVTVTFKGKYSGTKKLNFTITPEKIKNFTVSQTNSAITIKWNKIVGVDAYRVYKYNSKAKKYEKVKDVKGTSIKISDLKVGTVYNFKVRGYKKDEETIGGVHSDEIIVKTKNATPSVKLSATNYTYNGKVKTPSVTVKSAEKTLKKDTDYTVKYEKGRKLPGKYTVTVTFKGKYSGTKKLYFTIKPEKIKKFTVTQTTSTVTIKWKKIAGVDAYRVYKYNSKTKKYDTVTDVKGTSVKISKLKAGTLYNFKVRGYKKDGETIGGVHSDEIIVATKPATVKLSKVTAGKKQMTATWKTDSGASGYQVVYSTSKKFTSKTTKKVAVKKGSAKKTTIKKLTKGKKYFVKVRAYKTVNKKNVYGAYSAVKSIKVK